MNDPLPKIWWLYVPLMAALVQIILEISLASRLMTLSYSEDGPHEFLQFLVILSAFIVAVFTLFKMELKKDPYLFAYISLAAVCCFYVAGEEISWGQHIMDWSTPDYWANLNDQGETNLHNTSSWLDQKPRLILLIGIVTGGLIIPLLRLYKPGLVPKRFEIIYPPAYLALIAFLCLAVQIGDDIDSALTNISLFARASEVEELFMFYFVLLYLIVMKRRILKA